MKVTLFFYHYHQYNIFIIQFLASLPLNNKLYANKRIDEEIIIDNVRILDVDR